MNQTDLHTVHALDEEDPPAELLQPTGKKKSAAGNAAPPPRSGASDWRSNSPPTETSGAPAFVLSALKIGGAVLVVVVPAAAALWFKLRDDPEARRVAGAFLAFSNRTMSGDVCHSRLASSVRNFRSEVIRSSESA